MFDVTTFLIRWFFLSNLARDVAEIQTLPCRPYHPPPIDRAYQHHLSRQEREQIWRDDCIQGILSYPPGMQRLLVLDALRVELVQLLHQKLQHSSKVLKRHNQRVHPTLSRTLSQIPRPGDIDQQQPDQNAEDGDDPFLDTDVEILKAFAPHSDDTEITVSSDSEDEDHDDIVTGDQEARQGHHTTHNAMLVISKNGTSDVIEEDDADGRNATDSPTQRRLPTKPAAPAEPLPSAEEVREATDNLRDIQDYVPQLVSAVLKSPPAFDPNLSNPIQKLRHLLLRQCVEDPNWGIDLCWLLEAEVGRTWKTLFEHRQQTGRRLIVVLPAEKAAVLAKIGTEKREAFDLLQDAEQATAYGYTFDPEKMQPTTQKEERDDIGIAPRLPSSLSLRRCSHFGDTMHFIDRLTKISLDLRMVPPAQRTDYLFQHLHEMNRRIWRRMVTRGDVSLDVEDNRNPFDWPQTADLAVDMLKYSVHFPLIPQTGIWPDGTKRQPQLSASVNHDLPESLEVVRVLNIVVPESRILASRERCPYLLHMEVADTQLDGSDARLYASGAPNLGATVEEALGMSALAGAAAATQRHSFTHPSYNIPDELLGMHQQPVNSDAAAVLHATHSNHRNALSHRGGWQSDETFALGDEFNGGYSYSNPYDDVRQHEYEQLHKQMHSHQPQPYVSEQAPNTVDRRTVSVGSELLDKVFGVPWSERCREIREASPFGHVQGWRLASFIMKAGEDIRREALVMQIISRLRTWFQQEIPEPDRPFMRPYTIMCVGGDAGLLECLSDAKSVDEVKKQTDGFSSLRDYFERAYGPPSNSPPGHQAAFHLQNGQLTFEGAQDNFLRSLVGYSLVCYILQIKDRHNANILLDRDGHIMHIDFGFVLGDTPKMGKVPIFSERAPFKLSGEFWDVLGGWNISSGGLGVRFCKMFELAFACASSHADEIASLVEGTMLTLSSTPEVARSIANRVRNRLRMRGPPGSVEQKTFIMDLVNAALTSWGTSTYDWLQRSMNGYQ